MSVVLTIAGKKYSLTSSSVENEILQAAGRLFDEAVVEVSQKNGGLTEGQLSAMVAMRCIVPLLQEKMIIEQKLESLLQQLREVQGS